MKNKTIIAIAALIIIAISGFCTYYLFFDINQIEPGELICHTRSPDGSYDLCAYKNNDGATTDYAVLGVLFYNDGSNKTRNIYWDYHCDSADIQWIDDDTVVINSVTIDDVTKDKYDFRVDSQ